jgi:hypothetical protein
MTSAEEQKKRTRRIALARDTLDAKLGGNRVAITEPGMIWLLLCDLLDEVADLKEALLAKVP